VVKKSPTRDRAGLAEHTQSTAEKEVAEKGQKKAKREVKRGSVHNTGGHRDRGEGDTFALHIVGNRKERGG